MYVQTTLFKKKFLNLDNPGQKLVAQPVIYQNFTESEFLFSPNCTVLFISIEVQQENK